MKNNLLKLLLATLLLPLGLQSRAEFYFLYEYAGFTIYYYVYNGAHTNYGDGISSDGYGRSGCTIEGEGPLILPEYVEYEGNKYTLVEIAKYSFCYKYRNSPEYNKFIGVEMPNSIKTIGEGAFYGNEKLKSVSFSNSLESIGMYAFRDCSDLESIDLPESLTEIGASAFYKCSSLASVHLPESLIEIGGSCFSGCSSLTSIVIPKSVETIGGYALSASPNLERVIIEGTPTFGNNIFESSDNVSQIVLKSSTPPVLQGFSTNIYDRATIIVPEEEFYTYSQSAWGENFKKLSIIGHEPYLTTLYQTDDFTYALIPETHQAILIKNNYSDLTSATIPSVITKEGEDGTSEEYTVYRIGEGAFRNCSNLTEVNLPSSLKEVAVDAFADCVGLSIVEAPEEVEYLAGYNGTSIAELDIPAQVGIIGNSAFADCQQLKKVIINGCPDIESNAFSGSTVLESLVLESLTPIKFEDDAFNAEEYENTFVYVPLSAYNQYLNSDWSKFKHILFSPSDGQFAYSFNDLIFACDETTKEASLKKGYNSSDPITIPLRFATTNPEGVRGAYNVTRIDNEAFKDCAALTSITFPKNLREIGSGAFSGCVNLTGISIPASVTRIEDDAFAGCSEISAIEIPMGVTYLSGFGATGLTEISIPASVTEIGNKAFADTQISSILIPNAVTSLGEEAFHHAPISTLTLGGGLRSIGKEAFSGCNLSEVVVPSSVETIGESAFADNVKLEIIKIGHGIKEIGENAFANCKLVSDIYVTAPVPPVAHENSFSDYALAANLWLHDQTSVNSYEECETLWWNFMGFADVIETPVNVLKTSKESLTIAIGETKKFEAAIEPANATLPHIFWKSSNPAVATVDHNGNVTVHAMPADDEPEQQNLYYDSMPTITATSMHADIPQLEFTVIPSSTTTKISEISTAYATEVYTLNGLRVGNSTDGLPRGVYIVRQGKKTSKIVI